MRILLDTHILLWALGDPDRLGERARTLLEDPDNTCYVSAASVWETAIKVRLGKYRLPFPLQDLEAAITEAGLQELDVTIAHALAIELVQLPHADPFDRLLLAQCEIETLRLVSADIALSTLPIVLPA